MAVTHPLCGHMSFHGAPCDRRRSLRGMGPREGTQGPREAGGRRTKGMLVPDGRTLGKWLPRPPVQQIIPNPQ